MVATSQARSRYCPPVLPEHQAMRSCPTWAMGNVLGVPEGKAILGRTGESDHFDHSRPIRGYHRDRKPSSSSPINTIKRQRKKPPVVTNYCRPGTGGRPDDDDGFDDQYFRRRPKSFCMERGR